MNLENELRGGGILNNAVLRFLSKYCQSVVFGYKNAIYLSDHFEKIYLRGEKGG